MNPAGILLEQWAEAAVQHPNIRLEAVPLEDTVPDSQGVLDHLGEKIDLISCPYETACWGDRCQSFYLRDLPVCPPSAGAPFTPWWLPSRWTGTIPCPTA